MTTITFNNNNRTLTLAASFADDDVIYIDFKRGRVYRNGAKMEYSGTFPKFPRGDNTFTVTVNGSARLYDLLILNIYKYK